ncbi:peptidase C39-like protein [Prauserella shujinwangii]|uniref:Peptidase C39-like protein n=1 Tax=Prauserella shujinwangii TaxID=1453103 RepID=A0A2T0M0R4_9PSEU|nr:C39 family peptidase [Prauserella shujinwangii]PRX50185.1 peptidase C39-like protein [Prauserella shujinwangii]
MRGRVVIIVLAVLAASTITGQAAAEGGGHEKIDHHGWSGAGLASGRLDGVVATRDGLRIGEPAGTFDDGERTYEYGRWTSPVHAPGFDATELIASWNAGTPERTWLRIEARTRTAGGDRTAWYELGRWAHGDTDIRRTSVPGQSDEHARVSVDTLVAKPGVRFRAFQLRVTLYRARGGSATPVLRAASAMTSRVPDRFTVPISAPGVARGIELPVPRYAQNIHKGRYPEYGGGGQNWCSPTSTAMVLDYWNAGPDEHELSWLPSGYPDPAVAHAARHTYDHAYEGTGNWPFNTAYAARYGLRAHVTRLHSLAELERYIARGVPVITSQSFLERELDGAGYGTAGHLMVVIGFTQDGDVIVNDPAADSSAGVRNVYPRAQFETIWQRTLRHDAEGNVAGGPGGIVYLVTR